MTDTYSGDQMGPEGAQSVAAPPPPLLSDQLLAVIAEWDRMDPTTRPVEIDTFVIERMGFVVPRTVRIERLKACALEWDRQSATGKAGPRREIAVDPIRYRPVLDQLYENAKNKALAAGKTPPMQVDKLRKIQKYFLDRTGFVMSHGQLGKYAGLAQRSVGVADSPADQADLIRDWMRNTKTRELVKQGNQEDKRKYLDSFVRVTERGLRDRQRALEAELRAMQNAKKPFEAGVKAARDLYEYAQYVHAVGQTLADMPLFCVEEIGDALEDLADQISLVCNEIAVIQSSVKGTPAVDKNVVINVE